MTFLNISSLISTAINAPAMLPRATGSSSLESVLKSRIFFCLKPLTDTTFCNKMAIRLVAFATFADEDKKRYYQHGAAPGKRVDKSRGSTEEYGDDDFDNCHGAKLKTKTQKLKVYREYFRG